RLQFEIKITVGNLLTILALAVAAVFGYATLQAELAHQADRITTLEASTREVTSDTKTQQAVTDSRLRAVEVLQASQTSDLKNIQTGINEIKAALANLQASQRAAK
ncbi:MAG: hypothetical protein EBT13_14300, partial [Rhodobacteraceae bacterium]|nr:hypothetical protein [Paracoccaceae bacterium]